MKAFSAFLIGLILLTAGCAKQNQGGEMVVSVVAAPVNEQAVEETIEAVGTLMANESVDVKSETEGTIEAIHFQEGEAVKKGDVLIELDQVKLRSALTEAEAHLTMAEVSRQRYLALLQSGAVAQQEVDQTEATWAASQALVAGLKSELEDATIRAPFDGITGARLLSLGQFIPRGTQLTSLVDPNPMKLEFRVPERFLSQIKLGQSVKLETDVYSEKTFEGKVYFIDPLVDTGTRTVLVKATVPNDEGLLRHGMFVHSELIVRVAEQALVIPEIALLYQGDLIFVYTIDNQQKVQMRPVKVGLRLADKVEITEGLESGEQVVAEGHQKVFPGAKVAPKQPAPIVSTPNAA